MGDEIEDARIEREWKSLGFVEMRRELATLRAENARLKEALKKTLRLPGLVGGAMEADFRHHEKTATKYWAEAEAIETEARRALEEG